jgi:Xaa-Pro aminopeptidase
MRPITEEKLEELVSFINKYNLDSLMIMDLEVSRNVNLQYLSGHPNDATVIITSNGESLLIPWDINLAEKHSEVDQIIDPSNYQYNTSLVLKNLIEKRWKKSSYKMGVHENIPYGIILKLQSLIPSLDFFKEPRKITQKLRKLRSTKSEEELNLLKKSAEIANKTIDDIRNFALNANQKSENDLSFLVRKKMSDYGAEDIAFDTLVANSNRSHEIHCHPPSTNQQFDKKGFALIDFGAKYKGYHSDITVPICFRNMNEEQQKMYDTTSKAYEEAIGMIEIDVPLWMIHEAAIDIIEKEGFSMPHSLGHGLGLSEHDAPIISRKPTDDYTLKYWEEERVQEGMVFTIEPGIYKKGIGGIRIENDVMIKNGKAEIITDSKMIYVN